MKRIVLSAIVLLAALVANAQSFKETFDGNSLEWTECTFDNKENIKFYIHDGVMTVHSEKNTDFWTGQVSYSAAESFCYSPLDVQKSFKIVMHLKYSNEDFPCGFRFNELDDGNFYQIAFGESVKKIQFSRFKDNKEIGGLMQGFPFPKLKKGEWREVILEHDGSKLSLTIQGIPVFNIKTMPMTYNGFSFFTYGEQELTVDDIEFIQY